MRRALPILCGLLLLASCGGKEPAIETAVPAIKAEVQEAASYTVSLSVSAVHTETLLYGYSAEEEPVINRQYSTGSTSPVSFTLTLVDLLPEKSYRLILQGKGPAGETGNTVRLEFTTLPTPSDLYSWERARSSIPVPADMTLIPGPSSHRNPLEWSKDRWLKHVAYTDEEGREHWLFDSFLLIEGQQNGAYGSPSITYVLSERDQPSATKADWQHLLDFWFTGGDFLWQESRWSDGVNIYAGGRTYTGETRTLSFHSGQLDALDECVGDVATRIGPPSHKRYVVMALPEPIYFDNYIRAMNNGGTGNTVYWGSLDGKALDFSRADHRIEAYKWFMDETRRAFGAKNYANIELLGFYILPEVLSTTWRKEYKLYDTVIPAVAEYAHSCNEALFWIPYCKAEGYSTWKSFGFDLAYMQPNYYWDGGLNGKPSMAEIFREINRYQMGLELEFEYSMVQNVQGELSAQLYRERFEQYLEWAKSSGLYGKRSIALYSGTDAMAQLAGSPLPGDRTLYHKLGHFIIESPLKN